MTSLNLLSPTSLDYLTIDHLRSALKANGFIASYPRREFYVRKINKVQDIATKIEYAGFINFTLPVYEFDRNTSLVELLISGVVNAIYNFEDVDFLMTDSINEKYMKEEVIKNGIVGSLMRYTSFCRILEEIGNKCFTKKLLVLDKNLSNIERIKKTISKFSSNCKILIYDYQEHYEEDEDMIKELDLSLKKDIRMDHNCENVLFLQSGENKLINVESIQNVIYIGDIVRKNTNAKSKWKLDYKCDKLIQTKENGRIYLIVVDDVIYKIGSSECKGGIKSTFSFYEGGLGGSPSIRTFGIHLLIQEQLELGKKIQIFVLFIEPIKVKISGLQSSIEKTTYPQIKEMEDLCREDYKRVYGKYPRWNFQENVEEWPEYIKEAYKEQVKNR